VVGFADAMQDDAMAAIAKYTVEAAEKLKNVLDNGS